MKLPKPGACGLYIEVVCWFVVFGVFFPQFWTFVILKKSVSKSKIRFIIYIKKNLIGSAAEMVS